MKILLISGHGAGDPGAVGTFMGRTYREADEAVKVVEALARALEGYADATVYPMDRNAFHDYQNGSLAANAKFSRYDYVLEVHFNALRGTEPSDGKTKGTECYVTKSETGVTVEAAICRKIAALGLTNRGVKAKNWSVIHQAKRAGVSSALLEVCFIDDPDDMAVYVGQGVQKVAEAIRDGIVDGFGLRNSGTDELGEARRIVREKAGLEERTMDYLEDYTFGPELIKKLAAAMK